MWEFLSHKINHLRGLTLLTIDVAVSINPRAAGVGWLKLTP